jgi:hypothetical protein
VNGALQNYKCVTKFPNGIQICTEVGEHGKHSAAWKAQRRGGEEIRDVLLSGVLVVAPVVCDMAKESELHSSCASFSRWIGSGSQERCSSSDRVKQENAHEMRGCF